MIDLPSILLSSIYCHGWILALFFWPRYFCYERAFGNSRRWRAERNKYMKRWIHQWDKSWESGWNKDSKLWRHHTSFSSVYKKKKTVRWSRYVKDRTGHLQEAKLSAWSGVKWETSNALFRYYFDCKTRRSFSWHRLNTRYSLKWELLINGSFVKLTIWT